MIIRSETFEQQYKRLSEWHTVFAWRPKRVSPSEKRWLEPVQRRARSDYSMPREKKHIVYEYRSMPQAFMAQCKEADER